MSHIEPDRSDDEHPEEPRRPTDVVVVTTKNGDHLLYEENQSTAWISADNAIPISEVQ
ncbi:MULTISPECIES: hypothetical protein [Haloferax]|uniref:hypothetical protein n=1 Tax=Haloferax TaxID=2251 RepID=UPI000B25D416|nr:hypothetical protein [Haloferax mediterranei]MDX5990133.1 hypothetical protein [Haloferax mediterranei ATCC 33500]